MRHIISILLQNEAGALARVAGAFSSRGYNIDSLSVAPTHDPSVSRLTLVTSGSDAVIDQIIKQSRKLVDVVEIMDLSSTDHIECELLMVKIAVDASTARSVVECVRAHRAFVLDETESTRMIQLAGAGPEIDAFVEELSRLTKVLELVRSGVAAMERGHNVIEVPA
ncbi:acetolactate synthase small subunit [Sinimarinibacterium sp. CAU 1509]|uniref:acetolactate synthase small subunit n=1 Tax=Sinimarinibacterium sp. CAU 1509 TaxID=2562283 RepID=UPI0010AC5A62|nr:acetolactate synthase small subunit [Sinimarinibacterium sp. CAU 1509]TJY62808.1 acetolactate synthase small subunit [Sinimarinibacterium sp. CAU 1509]